MPTHLFSLLALALLLSACNNTPPPPETPSPPQPHTLAGGEIRTQDPRLAELLDPTQKIRVLAEGFNWSEGPVWVPAVNKLLFSDVPENTMYAWSPGTEEAEVHVKPSGDTGYTTGGKQGANGLLLDKKGALLLCQHGDRRVARMDNPASTTEPVFETVADRYDDKRFNSPNDLVLRDNGSLFFTDPPYGLADGAESEERDLPYFGVYRVDTDGSVHLVLDSLNRPNGIELSPDGNTLYVANSDPEKAYLLAYELDENGNVTGGGIFADLTEARRTDPGNPDGMVVDDRGNLYATGPGGIWIYSPQLELLGRIMTNKPTANCTIGGPDGKTLFLTADDTLLSVKLL